MENKLGFLGKHTNDTSVFLNMGKYGYYLNFDDKYYSVPACFQDKKFNLESAIKIIDYKSKLASEQKKLEMESSGALNPLRDFNSTKDYVNKVLAETHKSDLDDIKNNEIVNEKKKSTRDKLRKFHEAVDITDVNYILQDIKNKKSLKKTSNE